MDTKTFLDANIAIMSTKELVESVMEGFKLTKCQAKGAVARAQKAYCNHVATELRRVGRRMAGAQAANSIKWARHYRPSGY